MVERVTHRVGHRLGPLLELLPIRGIARAVALGYAICSHCAPLIVVARKPYLREVAELMVARHILGVEVAVIVDDGHFCRVVVVQSLGRRALQKEIFVIKLFHGRLVFGFNYSQIYSIYLAISIPNVN